MNKPRRLVMSMVPNKDYLHGYNQCVEDTEEYRDEVRDLLIKVLETHYPRDPKSQPAALHDEVIAFLLEDAKAAHENSKLGSMLRVSGYRATDYDVDMDQEREAQEKQS